MVTKGIAHAKVNLALHVTRRLSNGYHAINSLIVFTRFGDGVELALSDVSTLAASGPFRAHVPQGNDNLMFQGLNRLQLSKRCDFAIALDKKIPVGAGLGGGSSNAATVLKLASRMLSRPLPSVEELTALGADIPVCVVGKTCVVAGTGNIIEPLDSCPALSLLLVNPDVSLATGLVFENLQRTENPSLSKLPSNLSLDELMAWLRCQRNDLEETAIRLCPVISDALRCIAVSSGCLLARMTGSGPTCFGIYDSLAKADEAAAAIRQNHPSWWVQTSMTLI